MGSGTKKKKKNRKHNIIGKKKEREREGVTGSSLGAKPLYGASFPFNKSGNDEIVQGKEGNTTILQRKGRKGGGWH